MNECGKSIVLIGMMGAGKSSVAGCLQRRTKWKLLETDEIVASKFGMSIREIFAKHGEDRFRDAETDTLRELTNSRHAILTTGGGIVLRKKNIDLLKQFGVVVWLDGDEGTLFERASQSGNRPLLHCDNPRKAFAQMLNARLPLYARLAHFRVDTSMLTAEEAAVAILTKVGKFGDHLRSRSPVSAGKS